MIEITRRILARRERKRARWRHGFRLRDALSALSGSILVYSLALFFPHVLCATGLDAQPFVEQVQPILEEYCGSCHASGMKKGNVNFEGIETDEKRLGDRKLWSNVLKNTRAGLMPPSGKPRPSGKEQRILEDWIKITAFSVDPRELDPGRVTVRRLNRVEYRNTIRDLMGVEYDTSAEFPPDDSGHGFDNIGDVLTMSPLLLEKYIKAADLIVAKAVPTTSRVVAEKILPGCLFQRSGGIAAAGAKTVGPLSLSYYDSTSVSCTFRAEHTGQYRLILDLAATERFVDGVFDYNKCRLAFKVDGQELVRREYSRQDGKSYRYEVDRDWKAGPHELTFEVAPLTPGEKRVRSLALRINSVTVQGPFDSRYWTLPANYARYFPRAVPDDLEARLHYARELLSRFTKKAFRRPVDKETIDRLVAVVEAARNDQGKSFEAGVATAMTVVLSSPRFVFREEDLELGSPDRYPLLDEYALAARLSYFLWSSMPDDELFHLADEHKLRANLAAELKRMLADPRSAEFFRHFVGQWLQTRDVETVLINAPAVIAHDEPRDPSADRRRSRFRELNHKPAESLSALEKDELKELRATVFRSFRRFREFELTRDLRQAMRQETEMLFEDIVRHDRSLVELLDSDYTFLNERLAKHYGIDGVQGDAMRRVALRIGGSRGGILTQGSILIVTSNPDRTSPVKRGLFILDNILGIPPPPPPPNIPPLEDAGKKITGRTPTLRESLALHRDTASCASCHNRMDPLGLALENYNALGRWRDKDGGQPIDASGRLITGEEFKGIGELKRILVDRHRRDFYRCLSEKMLIYALGRGLDYCDVETVDRLVQRIEAANGRPQALLMGIAESAPFQRRRRISTEPDKPAPGNTVRTNEPTTRERTMTLKAEQFADSISRRRQDLSRHHFLRGLGACVAVPALGSLRSTGALAAAPAAGSRLATTPTGAPLRAAFVYFPNGAIPASWWPKQEGLNVPLSRTLQPLESSKESIQVLGGLNHRTAEGGPDGAGDHARGNGTFLTGVRLKKSATELRGNLHRPGPGAQDRPPYAVPLARAGVRDRTKKRGLRFGLLLRLPVQHLVELCDHAHARRIEPAARLRAPVWSRFARRAERQLEAASGRAEIDPRSRPRRRAFDAAPA